MRIIVTAGPTREHIDSVRFITNASSGKMGCAVAQAAARAGHRVTLLAGPVCGQILRGPERAGCRVQRFLGVGDLQAKLRRLFARHDALVMTAAVGDFTVDHPWGRKLSRKGGPVRITLVPTPDVLAGVAARKSARQVVVAFAVEQGSRKAIQRKAAAERIAKNADLVVLNTPKAMAADASEACVLGPRGVVLPWKLRPKPVLARAIVRLIELAAKESQ
jgi:phosphopantothenoylcysteine decarboxylase/phosphopantothenate--cysteine ligase